MIPSSSGGDPGPGVQAGSQARSCSKLSPPSKHMTFFIAAHNRFHHNCCDDKKPPTVDQVKAKSIENANKRKRSRYNRNMRQQQQQQQTSSRSSPESTPASG